MKLEIFRGDIVLVDGRKSGMAHVGVSEPLENESDYNVLCVCGPAGDPESELMAHRIKAMCEFCEPFSVEFMEQAAEARAKRRIENFINTGRAI